MHDERGLAGYLAACTGPSEPCLTSKTKLLHVKLRRAIRQLIINARGLRCLDAAFAAVQGKARLCTGCALVGGGEVQAQAARLCADQEDKGAAVLVVEVVDLSLTLRLRLAVPSMQHELGPVIHRACPAGGKCVISCSPVQCLRQVPVLMGCRQVTDVCF